MNWMLIGVWVATVAPASPESQADEVWSPEVEQALAAAGENRGQLEGVLRHYAAGGDKPALAAACFLIGNMEGHGYVIYGLFDEQGNEVPFHALEYKNLREGQAALDELEKTHGELEFRRKQLVPDLEVVTSEYLIENIDLAFHAWRNYPWARELSFEAFCEHVLPYRGSNEPIGRWREDLAGRIEKRLQNESPEADAKTLQGAAMGACPGIGFRDLYYLHPTDQSYAEMLEHGVGRCEDQTNMSTYAHRAACVASAADYTPYWANRDNNHAWSVRLDAEGTGRAGLSHRAAKIYRKTYSAQRQNLAFQLREGEKAPPWLDRKTYQDVTRQYLNTTDVTVVLSNDPPADARFAYLAVFNGGEWKAIHWTRFAEGRATFDAMGRGVVYLPAYYIEEALVPAADPFFLTSEGEMRVFAAAESMQTITPPSKRTAEGKTYELFVWQGGWVSCGKQKAGAEGVSFPDVPTGALYWLVQEDSRRLERVFAILANGEWLWM